MDYLFTSGVVACVLHEAGHIVCAKSLGVEVKQVGINWKGFYVRRSLGTPAQNLAITLAGPMVNVMLVLLWKMFPAFALANLIVGVVNLLPIRNSDGSRALGLMKSFRERR